MNYVVVNFQMPFFAFSHFFACSKLQGDLLISTTWELCLWLFSTLKKKGFAARNNVACMQLLSKSSLIKEGSRNKSNNCRNATPCPIQLYSRAVMQMRLHFPTTIAMVNNSKWGEHSHCELTPYQAHLQLDNPTSLSNDLQWHWAA